MKYILIIIGIVIILIVVMFFVKEYKKPILIKAIKKGDINLLKELIEQGSDIEIKDSSGKTGIFYAEKDILDLLISKGVDINIKENGGWSPLMVSAFNFEYEKVEKLIKNGANINDTEQFGQTALILCLVQAGLGLSKKEEILTDKIIKLLIDNKADINIKDEDGRTALDYAKRQEHINILKNN